MSGRPRSRMTIVGSKPYASASAERPELAVRASWPSSSISVRTTSAESG